MTGKTSSTYCFCIMNQDTIFTINFYNIFYDYLPETTLGEKIKKERLKKGLTQDKLSYLSGVLRSTINDYEQDYIKPSITNLNKLKKVLSIKLNL